MPKVYIKPEKQDNANAIDAALRKLKKVVESDGTLKKLHEKEAYETKGQKRKRMKNAAVRRWQREVAMSK